LAAIASCPAFAQIQQGSVAVVYYSEAHDKIIMAADSRALWTGNPVPDNTACKIAAPQGKMLFVSTNFGGWKNGGPKDVVPSWMNVEEIHRAYNTASMLYTAPGARVHGAADEWGKLTTSHFQALLQEHPEAVTEFAKKNHGVLTKAFIGGLGNRGTMLLWKTTVSYQQGVVSYEMHGVGCPNSFCPIGGGAEKVAEEFTNQTSPRAIREAKEWKPPKSSKPEDYDILKTMRFVELSIKYYKGNDVGGKIDAVEMSKDGSVHWYTAKPNCTQD
jgi:hypothetical protein